MSMRGSGCRRVAGSHAAAPRAAASAFTGTAGIAVGDVAIFPTCRVQCCIRYLRQHFMWGMVS